jgi:hypothetical protein
VAVVPLILIQQQQQQQQQQQGSLVASAAAKLEAACQVLLAQVAAVSLCVRPSRQDPAAAARHLMLSAFSLRGTAGKAVLVP